LSTSRCYCSSQGTVCGYSEQVRELVRSDVS
jgi:hypothetical protein